MCVTSHGSRWEDIGLPIVFCSLFLGWPHTREPDSVSFWVLGLPMCTMPASLSFMAFESWGPALMVLHLIQGLHFNFMAWLSFCPLSTSQRGLNSIQPLQNTLVPYANEFPCLCNLTLSQGQLKFYCFFYFWLQYRYIISSFPFLFPNSPIYPSFKFFISCYMISVCVYTNIFLNCSVCIMLVVCMFSGCLV